ncbi:hypothetical protein JW978_02285 [Candidatus Dojkabacteria bacterium]|nr:hypothetical protein [Candidatus Dojkabacteria bacterium]
MKENVKIDNIFTDLGFSPNETKIYLELLSLKSGNIASITKQSGIPRTTVTRTIEKLIAKGLVSQGFKNSERILIAENPKKLENLIRTKEIYIEEQQEEVKKQKNELYNLLPLIETSFERKESSPLLRYYEGITGFRDVCSRSLDYADNEILFLSNHQYWRQVFTEDYDSTHYIPQRLKKRIKMRSLVVKNTQGERLRYLDKNKLRETRYLPDTFDFQTTFIIYSNEVSIMVSLKPYIAINMRNESIYKAFKNIFENIWNSC